MEGGVAPLRKNASYVYFIFQKIVAHYNLSKKNLVKLYVRGDLTDFNDLDKCQKHGSK